MKGKFILFCLMCIAVILSYLLYEDYNADLVIDNTITRLTEVNTTLYYEVVTENTMNCDLATFSTIVNNMVKAGFTIKKESNTDKLVDIILIKDDTTVRIRYTANGDFASISDPYEKSYLPITYISDSSVQ